MAMSDESPRIDRRTLLATAAFATIASGAR